MKILCRISLGIRMAFDWFMSMIDALFNKHKFVRRTIVFIALGLITWTVLNAIPRLEQGHLLSALIAVIGILGSAIAFYQWLRTRDGD